MSFKLNRNIQFNRDKDNNFKLLDAYTEIIFDESKDRVESMKDFLDFHKIKYNLVLTEKNSCMAHLMGMELIYILDMPIESIIEFKNKFGRIKNLNIVVRM
jgi:hypothetical protein